MFYYHILSTSLQIELSAFKMKHSNRRAELVRKLNVRVALDQL